MDAWLLGILLLSLVLNIGQLNWGLPNGNHSWAADSIGPVTALGIAQRSFSEWNSGWFWFKYPLGYPFLLIASFLPYLGYQYVVLGWRPVSTYPFGFDDPEQSLLVLALCGRMLSVVFGVGAVLIAYGIGRRLFGVLAGRCGAFFVATAYPVIYYSHTTNLDIGYLFWLVLALYCAILADRTDRLLPWIGLGAAAAMAIASKEQAFAFLLPLPLLVIVPRMRREGSLRGLWCQPVGVMVGAAVATTLLANNVFFNPSGFVARLAYLLGHPLQPVPARLAPVEFSLWKGAQEWVYVRQLWDAVESSLGAPLAILAGAGAVTALARADVARWLLVPAASYYFISLRALELITLRYTLPLQVVGAVLAAGLLQRAYRATRPPGAATAAVLLGAAVMALGLARAVEFHQLLRSDPRYQAERWMSEQLATGSLIEVYQKPVYLPRFSGDWVVGEIPIDARSPEDVERRRPDTVVLSSASEKSVTHVWSEDWRTTRDLLTPVPKAQEMKEALVNGDLGLRPVATFGRPTYLLRPRITSLNPTITIYARQNG